MKRKKSKSVVKGGGTEEYGDLLDVMSPTGGMELMRQSDPMGFINQPMSSLATALMNLISDSKKPMKKKRQSDSSGAGHASAHY